MTARPAPQAPAVLFADPAITCQETAPAAQAGTECHGACCYGREGEK